MLVRWYKTETTDVDYSNAKACMEFSPLFYDSSSPVVRMEVLSDAGRRLDAFVIVVSEKDGKASLKRLHQASVDKEETEKPNV